MISFGSIFLLLSYESSQGPRSQPPGEIPNPHLLMTALLMSKAAGATGLCQRTVLQLNLYKDKSGKGGGSGFWNSLNPPQGTPWSHDNTGPAQLCALVEALILSLLTKPWYLDNNHSSQKLIHINLFVYFVVAGNKCSYYGASFSLKGSWYTLHCKGK